MTDKQQRYCEEYVKDLNGTDAAIRAGYSPTSAASASSKLLAKKEIEQYINFLQAEIAERNNISADMVVKELADIGFSNIQDLIDEKMSLVNLKKANRKHVKVVAGIQITETFSGTGKKKKRTVKTDVKLSDKVNALIHLGKHLGIFEKDNQQKSLKIKVTRK